MDRCSVSYFITLSRNPDYAAAFRFRFKLGDGNRCCPYVASENDLFPTLRLTKEKRELRQEINQQRS